MAQLPPTHAITCGSPREPHATQGHITAGWATPARPRRGVSVLADRIAAALVHHEPGWRLPRYTAPARRRAAPGKPSRWAPRPGPAKPSALTRPGFEQEHPCQRIIHGPGLRHAAHRAIQATAAAIILLALAACGSTTTTSAPASVLATGSPGPSGHTLTLTGSGSTFVAPLFAVAFAKYVQQHPTVTINYSAVGSSGGIAAFSARQVDFGASDVPMTASEQAAAQGGPVVQVPDALGGEGVAYNLDLSAGARLRLTGPVIARIFLGQITRWDDPAITALNPGITLPDAPISVVHRSDGSGTTYIFSNYLSSVDPTWAARIGTGKTLNWPVGGGAEGNGNVAATVFRTPFSIGYIEQAYSQGLVLLQRWLRKPARLRVEDDTVADQHQRRDRGDPECAGQLRLRLRVDLAEHCVRVPVRCLLEDRAKHAARPAPRRPEVDQHQAVAAGHCSEVLRCQRHGRRSAR